MAKSKIKIKPENKGKLRAEMGTPKGKNIPGGKLKKAEKSAKKRGDVAEEKRIVFAENAKKWKKGGKKKGGK